jgi:hypothetical protein
VHFYTYFVFSLVVNFEADYSHFMSTQWKSIIGRETRMKKLWIGFVAMASLCISVLLVQAGFGQEPAVLEVVSPAVCKNVENLTCVDSQNEFSMPVDKLYCFTRITGAVEDTEITHVWYYGDVERFRISLNVRSSSWRTYSSKTIQAHETGKWRVDVLDSSGTVLKTIPFTIVP